MKIQTIVLLIVISISFIELPLIDVKADSGIIVIPDDFQTIHEAVNNASSGDTIFVKKGYYETPASYTLTINTSISIIGEAASQSRIILHPNWFSGVILGQNLSHYGSPLVINADNVELINLTLNADGGQIIARGDNTKIIGCLLDTDLSVDGENTLVINNRLTGAYLVVAGRNQFISQNTFRVDTFGILCTGPYNTITLNDIIYGRGEGIVVENSHNTIYANTISITGESGIMVRYDSLSNVIAQNNITNSDHGIYIQSGSNNVIFSNRMSYCNYGIKIGWGSNNTFFENDLNHNHIGVQLSNNQSAESLERFGPMAIQNTIYHNNFMENPMPAIEWNCLGNNSWNHMREGNYWNNYNGTDNDGDGIGDSPYQIRDDIQDNYPLIQPVETKSTLDLEIPNVSTDLEIDYNIPEFTVWIVVPIFILSTIAVFFFKNKFKDV